MAEIIIRVEKGTGGRQIVSMAYITSNFSIVPYISCVYNKIKGKYFVKINKQCLLPTLFIINFYFLIISLYRNLYFWKLFLSFILGYKNTIPFVEKASQNLKIKLVTILRKIFFEEEKPRKGKLSSTFLQRSNFLLLFPHHFIPPFI